MNRSIALFVTAYIVSNVVANWLAAEFGTQFVGGVIPVTAITALLFIGLPLSARDLLHEHWQGRHLWRNMLLLIAAAGVITYVFVPTAAFIAIASFIAFIAAGITDTLSYILLGKYDRFVRMNGSNVASAAVDSILFPLLAFVVLYPGDPMPASALATVIASQLAAKVIGGAAWAWWLTRRPVAAATP
jgi:uncharacterized PurR-regulated membrane protein YhhQ (DUF165 family)